MPFFRKARSPRAAKGNHHFDVPAVASSYGDLRVELSHLLDQVNAVQEKLNRVQEADLKSFSLSHDSPPSRILSWNGPSTANSTIFPSLSSQDSPPPISEIVVHAVVESPSHSSRQAACSHIAGNKDTAQERHSYYPLTPASTDHCTRARPHAVESQQARDSMVSGGSTSSNAKSKQRKYRLVKRLVPVSEDSGFNATMSVTPTQEVVPSSITVLPSPKSYPEELTPSSPPCAIVAQMGPQPRIGVNSSTESRSTSNSHQAPPDLASRKWMGEASHHRPSKTKSSVHAKKREHYPPIRQGSGAASAALLAQIRKHDLELKKVDIVNDKGTTRNSKSSNPSGGLMAAIQAGVTLKHVSPPSRQAMSPVTHTSALLAKLQQRKKECQRRAELKTYDVDEW